MTSEVHKAIDEVLDGPLIEDVIEIIKEYLGHCYFICLDPKRSIFIQLTGNENVFDYLQTIDDFKSVFDISEAKPIKEVDLDSYICINTTISKKTAYKFCGLIQPESCRPPYYGDIEHVKLFDGLYVTKQSGATQTRYQNWYDEVKEQYNSNYLDDALDDASDGPRASDYLSSLIIPYNKLTNFNKYHYYSDNELESLRHFKNNLSRTTKSRRLY